MLSTVRQRGNGSAWQSWPHGSSRRMTEVSKALPSSKTQSRDGSQRQNKKLGGFSMAWPPGTSQLRTTRHRSKPAWCG